MLEMSDLKKQLSEKTLTVTFTKVNGDVRIMECTTNLDSVPPSMWPTEKLVTEEKKDSGSQIRVFDVKAKGWRSFKYENIISVE